jgi:hypothetical protein
VCVCVCVCERERERALWSPVDITQGIPQGVFEELHLRNLRLLNSELARCHAPPPPRRSLHPARNVIRTLSQRRHQLPPTSSSLRLSPYPSTPVSSRLADQTNSTSPNEILDVDMKCLYCDNVGDRVPCGHFNQWPLACLCSSCSTWHANDCSLGQRSCPICHQSIREDHLLRHSECCTEGALPVAPTGIMTPLVICVSGSDGVGGAGSSHTTTNTSPATAVRRDDSQAPSTRIIGTPIVTFTANPRRRGRQRLSLSPNTIAASTSAAVRTPPLSGANPAGSSDLTLPADSITAAEDFRNVLAQLLRDHPAPR